MRLAPAGPSVRDTRKHPSWAGEKAGGLTAQAHNLGTVVKRGHLRSIALSQYTQGPPPPQSSQGGPAPSLSPPALNPAGPHALRAMLLPPGCAVNQLATAMGCLCNVGSDARSLYPVHRGGASGDTGSTV